MLSKVEENFTMTSNFGCFSESVVGVHGFFSGHDFLVILLEVWPWYPTLSHYYRCSCSASKIKRHPDRENLSEDVPQIDHHPMSPCRNMGAECTRCSDNQIRFLLVTQCYTYVYIYIIIYNYYMSVYIYIIIFHLIPWCIPWYPSGGPPRMPSPGGTHATASAPTAAPVLAIIATGNCRKWEGNDLGHE